MDSFAEEGASPNEYIGERGVHLVATTVTYRPTKPLLTSPLEKGRNAQREVRKQ